MMPNLGQGGCQAIEDAFVLTEELCGVQDKRDIPDALQRYYQRRIVRTAIVQGMSRFSSDIIISQFSTPFSWEEFRKEGFNYKYLSFQSLLTSYLKNFLPAIFYAQFGYLYSYAPSAFRPDQIQKLVKNSVERNKAEVQAVYRFLKEGYVTFFTAKTMCFMHFNRKTKEMEKITDADTLRKETGTDEYIAAAVAAGAAPAVKI